MQTRWAVLGPGEISGYFARALPRSQFGMLHAVGSSDPGRASAFASQYGAPVSGTYDDILSRDDVDAVYIGTVHTTHATLAEAALRAGKAVLCEKPATTTLADTERVLEIAADVDRPFVEAFKTRFSPFAVRLAELVADGAIGDVHSVEVSRGFAASSHTGRLFDPALAGGALLDIGGYPTSLAVSVADWTGNALTPEFAEASGVIGETGVDYEASAVVRFGTLSATLAAAIISDLPGAGVITGAEGRLVLPDAYGERTESVRTFFVHRTGEEPHRIDVETVDPFAAEADAVSLALAEGRTEVAEMPWAHTRAIARILAEWRERIA